MRPLTLDDLLALDDYERERDENRRRVIQLKARRRLALGRMVSVVFENRLTVLHQVQELLRAQRLNDPDAVARELSSYNGLLPAEGSLGATLFIEPLDPTRIQEEMERFKGLDRGEHLWIDLGDGARVLAHFEAPHDPRARFRSTHYVQFSFAASERSALADTSREAALVLDHTALRARAPFSDDLRSELVRDLEE